MSELWDTLTTGLILSLLFIGVSYFFWKRYDKPTPLMIERQEEKARLKEERKTWREVEARMRADQEEAELKAAYEQRKAEERARAAVPASTEVKTRGNPWVWKPLSVATFEAKGEDANAGLRAMDQTDLGEEAVSDDDVLNAAELVQVRQDKGVQPDAEEPDWELIEKLEEIAEKEEIVLPDVPEAPDLDAVAAQSSEDVPAADTLPHQVIHPIGRSRKARTCGLFPRKKSNRLNPPVDTALHSSSRSKSSASEIWPLTGTFRRSFRAWLVHLGSFEGIPQ